MRARTWCMAQQCGERQRREAAERPVAASGHTARWIGNGGGPGRAGNTLDSAHPRRAGRALLQAARRRARWDLHCALCLSARRGGRRTAGLAGTNSPTRPPVLERHEFEIAAARVRCWPRGVCLLLGNLACVRQQCSVGRRRAEVACKDLRSFEARASPEQHSQPPCRCQ